MDPLTGVISLTGITLASLAALRLKKTIQEGFKPIPTESYTQSVDESQTRYNKFSQAINPFQRLFSDSDAPRVDQALGSTKAVYSPTSPETLKLQPFSNSYPLRKDDNRSVFQAIQFCKEAAKGSAPFSTKQGDFAFSEICGVCLTSGVDEEGKTFVGKRGMLLDPNAKETALKEQETQGLPFPRVEPALGRCEGAPNVPVFAISPELLQTYQNRLNCSNAKDIDSQNGCALCYETNTYAYVQPNVQTTPVSLVLQGIGRIVVSVQGKVITEQTLSDTNSIKVDLNTAKENDSFLLDVSPVSTENPQTPIVYGYLRATNPNGGLFTMPLNLLVSVDDETGSTPNKTGGFYSFSDIQLEVAKLRPAVGTTQMKLRGTIPFTFVQPNEFSAIDCPTAPFQTTAASVSAFATDQPCFAKGAMPGAYSKDCLQQRILDGGCTNQGTLYQNPQSLLSKNGVPQTLTDIYNTVANIASKNLVDPESTKQCTGRTIFTPCDVFVENPDLKMLKILNGEDKTNAGLKQNVKQCLSYIYHNRGTTEPSTRIMVGPTYTATSSYSHSQKDKRDIFCLPEGNLNPDRSEEALLTLARKADFGFDRKTGIAAVKSYLNRELELAIDTTRNGNTDPDRKAAILNCFGRSLNPLASPSGITEPVKSVSQEEMSIAHPDGRTWKVDGTTIRLQKGEELFMAISTRPDIFNRNAGRIALFQNNNPNLAVRHAGFTMYVNPFLPQNFDFAWKFIKTESGIQIYNDYGGGWFVGYDSPSDTVLIVPRNDRRIITWRITPFPQAFV
jgi:hypothetical protein